MGAFASLSSKIRSKDILTLAKNQDECFYCGGAFWRPIPVLRLDAPRANYADDSVCVGCDLSHELQWRAKQYDRRLRHNRHCVRCDVTLPLYRYFNCTYCLPMGESNGKYNDFLAVKQLHLVREITMKYGIQNLKELMDFGFSVGNGLQGALSDGKLDLGDVAFALPVIQTVGPALRDVNKIPAEFSDIDMGEAVELVSYAQIKLPGVSDKRVKEIVAKSLKVALSIGQLLHAFKEEESK